MSECNNDFIENTKINDRLFGNIFSWELLGSNPESFSAIIFFSIIFNFVFIAGRIGIYYSYEKYLN